MTRGLRFLRWAYGETMWIVLMGAWLAGVVFAAGWMKVLAIIVPPYAWYLVAERMLQMAGAVT